MKRRIYRRRSHISEAPQIDEVLGSQPVLEMFLINILFSKKTLGTLLLDLVDNCFASTNFMQSVNNYKNNWPNANLADRKKLMQQLLKAILPNLGIEGIELKKAPAEKMQMAYKYGTKSICYTAIRVNNSSLKKDSLIEVIFHECVHVIQSFAAQWSSQKSFLNLLRKLRPRNIFGFRQKYPLLAEIIHIKDSVRHYQAVEQVGLEKYSKQTIEMQAYLIEHYVLLKCYQHGILPLPLKDGETPFYNQRALEENIRLLRIEISKQLQSYYKEKPQHILQSFFIQSQQLAEKDLITPDRFSNVSP